MDIHALKHDDILLDRLTILLKLLIILNADKLWVSKGILGDQILLALWHLKNMDAMSSLLIALIASLRSCLLRLIYEIWTGGVLEILWAGRVLILRLLSFQTSRHLIIFFDG